MKNRKYLLLLFLLCSVLQDYAIDVRRTTPKGDVTVSYEIRNASEVYISGVTNHTGVKIIVNVDGSNFYINEHGSATIGKVCKRFVGCQSNNTSKESESFSRVTLLEASKVVPKSQPQAATEPETKVESSPQETSAASLPVNADKQTKPKSTASTATSLDQLTESIENDPFWGESATAEFVSKANDYSAKLNASASKKSYIENSNVLAFVDNEKVALKLKEEGLASFVIQNVVDYCSKNRSVSIELQNQIQADITKKLQARLKERKAAIQNLEKEIQESDESAKLPFEWNKTDIFNYCIIGFIVLVVLVLSVRVISKRSAKRKSTNVKRSQSQVTHDVENPTIVVRRKTTSILKKQCIDDVKDNPEYKKIATSEFCQDSAVRNIYIKNTCLKDIYDIYAEDLRNAERPHEDGCMVLGRWILDDSTKTYDVTLETIVLPGEDAVFKEYELNFGGKIKLRVAEKLRKLRKDTNLQYDLTCWVHSHPGLGVFFSNSDSNVQMQLKHAQHPNFLVAFVVDILTDKQEMGIFTFRHDGSINSKQDLSQMYSLEDLYKWAIESNKQSFSPDNYYNIMQGATLQASSCAGIELNNNAIIDLSRLAMESAETGLIGWLVGYQAETTKGNEYVISSVYKHGGQPGAGLMGCLISVAHMSLPTIQRIVNDEHLMVNFVCVYSTRQMTLTTMPVVNGELVNDEKYYAEETIENLKIWTRRR